MEKKQTTDYAKIMLASILVILGLAAVNILLINLPVHHAPEESFLLGDVLIWALILGFGSIALIGVLLFFQEMLSFLRTEVNIPLAALQKTLLAGWLFLGIVNPWRLHKRHARLIMTLAVWRSIEKLLSQSYFHNILIEQGFDLTYIPWGFTYRETIDKQFREQERSNAIIHTSKKQQLKTLLDYDWARKTKPATIFILHKRKTIRVYFLKRSIFGPSGLLK